MLTDRSSISSSLITSNHIFHLCPGDIIPFAAIRADAMRDRWRSSIPVAESYEAASCIVQELLFPDVG
jgi:hypothetical protein